MPLTLSTSIASTTLRDGIPNLPLAWRALLTAVILLLGVLGVDAVLRAAFDLHQHSDYTVYTAAGRAVWEGTNIYDAHNARGWNYVYLPLFSILMVPFAWLPVSLGAALWYLLGAAATASAVIMSVRLASLRFGANPRATLALWLVPALLAAPWLISGLQRGQASALMVWCVVAAIYFDRRQRQHFSAVALAAATLIKVFPAAMLVYFFARRRWRLLVTYAVVMLAGLIALPATVFGWQRNLDYLDQWHALVAAPVVVRSGSTARDPMHEQLLDVTRQRNQSLQALLVSAGMRPDAARGAWAAIAVGMLVAMLWLLRRGSGAGAALAAAFIAWTLLIPPISESHYFGLLVLPLAVLTATSRLDPDDRSRRLAVVVLLMFAIVGPTISLYKPLQLYRPLCAMTIAMWASLCWLARRGAAR
ncbi:MAG TPA: glycosyltransferase family 87 protein [Burkholderiales bacterium]|nr:glycosyltransferase family 87 protein [Burkholderiales bacterium]